MQRFRYIARQSSNTLLANLGKPRTTLWQLEALPLKGFEYPPYTSLLLPWVRCVPKTQLDRPTRLATIHSHTRQTDRRTDDDKASPYGRPNNLLPMQLHGGRVH